MKTNILEKIIAKVLKVTGYRFPKHEGLFSRESKSREILYKIGVSCVRCNLIAG